MGEHCPDCGFECARRAHEFYRQLYDPRKELPEKCTPETLGLFIAKKALHLYFRGREHHVRQYSTFREYRLIFGAPSGN